MQNAFSCNKTKIPEKDGSLEFSDDFEVPSINKLY